MAGFAYRNGEIHVLDAEHLTGQTWPTCKKSLEMLVKKGVLVFMPGKYVRDSRAAYVLTRKKG
jgi:hypothetical protein